MNDVANAQPVTFLDRLVATYNDAVRKRDFTGFIEDFCDDAVLEFDGVPDPPIAGKQYIALHYREDAPDDQIFVTRSKVERDRITAQFRWRDIPEATGGCFIVDLRGDKIAHLTIAFGGPATRCFD